MFSDQTFSNVSQDLKTNPEVLSKHLLENGQLSCDLKFIGPLPYDLSGNYEVRPSTGLYISNTLGPLQFTAHSLTAKRYLAHFSLLNISSISPDSVPFLEFLTHFSVPCCKVER